MQTIVVMQVPRSGMGPLSCHSDKFTADQAKINKNITGKGLGNFCGQDNHSQTRKL